MQNTNHSLSSEAVKALSPLPISQMGADDENDFPAIDPYQEFFDYLVAQGTAVSEAWDRVWENPRRSAQIGMKLAAYRIEPGIDYALS
ncbi:MAG: hypothetical protein DI586_01615 [Micavibrio aeruginosavorus]|uniref:Uncharacterized protein n=1 Tax=Micavibrio aeruginosavorus TaxID=349221 RepID=A0A2W5FTH8_9BACT|nr:MAG: hypothetical protein DI586_01615 [Micavibrio aeruginosavorus]